MPHADETPGFDWEQWERQHDTPMFLAQIDHSNLRAKATLEDAAKAYKAAVYSGDEKAAYDARVELFALLP